MLLAVLVVIAIVAGYEFTRAPHTPIVLSTPATDLTTLPGSKFEITYTPDTVVIDRATAVKALKSVSSDGNVLVFDSSVEQIKTLREGSVMLLQGLALRKVTAVLAQDSQIVVGTEPAALTDVIKEGNIEWDVPVDFGAARAEAAPQPSFTPDPSSIAWVLRQNGVVHAAGNATLSGKYKEWDYSVSATPAGGQLNLDMKVHKQVGGLEVDLTGNGYIQNFTTSASIQIHDGALQDMKYANKNMNGKMDFTWHAETSASELAMGKPEIKIPANISIPLPIGGLPFTLEISEAMIIKPALSGKNEVAGGKFNITYNGTDRFSLNGDTSGDEAHSSPEILNTAGVTISPMAFVAALAMPRVELKLSGMSMVKKLVPSELADAASGAITKLLGGKVEGLVEEKMKSEAAAYVEIVTTVAFIHSGPLNIVPCQKTTVGTTVKAGASASFLGKSVGDKEVELVHEEKEERVPPNVKCGDSDKKSAPAQ